MIPSEIFFYKFSGTFQDTFFIEHLHAIASEIKKIDVSRNVLMTADAIDLFEFQWPAYHVSILDVLWFICSKLTVETLEQDVKYVQGYQ